MITKLDAWAFKGLKAFTIEPKNVNLLIGANGTGKTNFADLIEFISLACRFGLKEAFDKRGGLGEVRTMLPGQGRPPALHCSISLGPDPYRGIEEADYSFTLSTSKSLVVDNEHLEATLYPRTAGRPTVQEKVKFDQSKPIKIKFDRKKGTVKQWSETLGSKPQIIEDEQNLILNIYGKLSNFRTVYDYLSSMRVYNIDATLAKLSANGNDIELERSGSNMIAFLKKVFEDNKLRQELLIDLRNAVPYIDNIVPERILTYTTLKFSELDSKLEFRAQQMSDGTIRLLGLLAVLRQPVPPSVVVIEEPENALHSAAIKAFLNISREVSSSDRLPIQIFLTSHSPAVVDAVLNIEGMAETSTMCFVTKRKDGTSTIEAASSKVITAIKKNIGRPSEFLRDGDFEDSPTQLEFDYNGGIKK